MDENEFTSRYEALGMGLPDPETMCPGDCEGTGYVPVKGDDANERYRAAWIWAEAAQPSDDGYHFVPCLECNGTGKKP